MMLVPLATENDAAAFGITVSEAALVRASARVRGYSRQTITRATHTLETRATVVSLPQRPLVSVTSVLDGDANDVDYELVGATLSVLCGHPVTITYEAGWTSLPDELIELVCTIAARMDQAVGAVGAGVQTESGGNESVTFGFDSYNALSDLATGEKRVLDRLFPKHPRLVVVRP